MRFKETGGYLATVTPKLFFGVLMTAFALTAYGCGADRIPTVPTAPLPPSSTVPANPTVLDRNPAGELWRLTTTIVSLEGSACFWTQPVGAKFDFWTLSVERNGAQIRLVYDVNNPHDNMLFVGAVNEQSFTAASDTYRSAWQCARDVAFSSSVVGSFSSDGRALSGRERLMYRVEGGGNLTITFEWSAARM